ncbi:MAG: YdhR family protein [Thermomicrobiales bacterium]|nr:YdhR family protein [Thermomicrobiales bacterium]
MHVLIITFKLVDLPDADYRQQATALAPAFLQVPGLVSKTWLADEAGNTYGGVYFFADAGSLQPYLDSAIVTGLKGNPAFAELTFRAFGVVEAATAITGGPLAGLGAAA